MLCYICTVLCAVLCMHCAVLCTVLCAMPLAQGMIRKGLLVLLVGGIDGVMLISYHEIFVCVCVYVYKHQPFSPS